MALTFGFYDSVDHDRLYNALQMSSIFDGIIRDGVFMHYGNHLFVTPQGGMNVKIDTGRAWFHHTWTLNDNYLFLPVVRSEVALKRIDTVILEVNTLPAGRRNSIYILKGLPASNPVRPTLTKANGIFQYPLADIAVNAGVTEIKQENITNRVGTSDCPYVTGPLELMNVDQLIAQWQNQYSNWFNRSTSEWNGWYGATKIDWNSWYANTKVIFDKHVDDLTDGFMHWFDNLRYVLEGDVATNLQKEIEDLQHVKPVTIPASGWSSSAPYTQTINVLGVTSEDEPIISLSYNPTSETDKRLMAKNYGYIDEITTLNGQIKVTCKFRKPDRNIPIVLKGV